MFSTKVRTGMAMAVAAVALLPATATRAGAQGPSPSRQTPQPHHTVYAHRGASGYRPEHTMGAYRLAVKMCADYIEPDLVETRDGVLVDRHEPEISTTTNVADHPEFASRRTTKTVDGTNMTGWFTEDFTLKELKTLRAKERLPDIRPANTAYDGVYQVPTFDEVLTYAQHTRTCSGQQLGVIPEIKHSTYFHRQGFDPEDAVVRALRRHGFEGKRDPVVIQSFEVSNLEYLHRVSGYNLVQLEDCSGGPADRPGITYRDMLTDAGMAAVAKYATSVGLCKDLMIPRDARGYLEKPTDAIELAHRHGLQVTGWTFRRENNFLPADFRSSDKPAEVGDLAAEIRTFLKAGMDNVFSDNPDVAAEVVRTW